jgi:hypothetical protein
MDYFLSMVIIDAAVTIPQLRAMRTETAHGKSLLISVSPSFSIRQSLIFDEFNTKYIRWCMFQPPSE